MLGCCRRFLFHIPHPPAGAEARRAARSAQPSSRSRQGGPTLRNGARDHAADAPETSFSSSKSNGRRSGASRFHRQPPGRSLRPGEPLPPPSYSSGEQGTYTSQRQAYRRQQEEKERAGSSSATGDVAGSYFTPFPRKYGFYDGLDEHTLATVQPTRQERQEHLRNSLESQAASVVEFTEGGEADIEMNGLPAEHFHGQAGWTTIPKDSALYNTMYNTGDMESRQRTNSWGVAMRHGRSGQAIRDLLGESAADASALSEGNTAQASQGEAPEVLNDQRRRRQHSESFYSPALEGELLAPTQESVGHPRSTYALRKLFVNGLVGYQGMISRAEEAAVSEELLHLLQSPRAAYIAEEARYCVNLYEKELGIPGKDTLAFGLSSCPTLQRVLYRFFFLGLIPSLPNVCQVSEMVGNFSGYPVHRHPRSIGSYVGLLNLVSTSVLHLQHKDAPWYPRLHLNPRSLFVVTEPCLGEYAMGYKRTQQPFHAFEYATRVSKDYRIEVLFATVETAQMRTLAEAVQLTEYATAKQRQSEAGGLGAGEPLLSASTSSVSRASSDSQDGSVQLPAASSSQPAMTFHGESGEWLEQLRAKLHAAGEGEDQKPLDGHALRRQLLSQHLVGSASRELYDSEETKDAASRGSNTMNSGSGNSSLPAQASAKTVSPAQRRLAALKARFEFAQNLKASQQQVEVSNSGPRLIRGHSPKDRHRGIT